MLTCRLDGPPPSCARTANISVWDSGSTKGYRYTQATFAHRDDGGPSTLFVHYVDMSEGTLKRCDGPVTSHAINKIYHRTLFSEIDCL